MYQSFDTPSNPAHGPARLADLRKVMKLKGFDGFLVPRADVHQGEYVAPRDARLSWLTGFTGSAGFCVALADQAGVFIDGRYRTQVKTQVDLAHFTPVPWPETTLGDWLITALPDGGTVAFDPWLHTMSEIDAAMKICGPKGVDLVPSENLIDMVWADQPAAPTAPMTVHPIEFAGVAHGDKRAALAKTLAHAGQAAAVITMTDSIAWLLNIRGADIERNPIAHALAILHGDATVDLFCNPAKTIDITDHLGADIRVRPIADFATALTQLDGPVRVDKSTAPVAVASALGDKTVWGEDPCALPKARKNPTETQGARDAGLRDAAAVVNFLAWFDETAPSGTLTEIDVVKHLEACRRNTGALREISFDTIAGFGANGAIMHYRVSDETNAMIETGQMMLVDSGGQYSDGTTDITRTIAVGDVGIEEKTCFTRVLQGMIAISRAQFPRGLAGRDLDALARYPLWVNGLDFNHGTGHGVGSYLCVHEGPQRLSRVSDVPFSEGMILSNEPGYYREGAFGIRIENLISVQKAPVIDGDDGRDMLSFETLTYVPLDRRLIRTDLLSNDERAWVDAYHAETAKRLATHVDVAAKSWLLDACRPL